MLGLEKVEPWMPFGACVEVEDPDLFFPNRDTDNKVSKAKAICSDCDVKPACLDYALRTPSSVGIWGGTTTAERSAIKKQRRTA